MRILLGKLKKSVKAYNEGTKTCPCSEKHIHMADNGWFHSLRAGTIHDTVTVGEEHCTVILEEHSKLTGLLQVSWFI